MTKRDIKVFIYFQVMSFLEGIICYFYYEISYSLPRNPGEGGWFIIFRLLKSILLFVKWISLYFFPISNKVLQYFVYYYCILIRLWYAVGTSFFRARFASFHSHASLLTIFFCFFILFHSCCSHARVFGKTLLPEFPISYSHTEWYLIFLRNDMIEIFQVSPVNKVGGGSMIFHCFFSISYKILP